MKRRTFIRRTATAAAGLALAPTIVPRRVLGGPGFLAPSDTVNIGVVGAGGMGASNMARLTDQNIVALADVDFAFVDRTVSDRLRDRDGNVRPEIAALQEAYGRAARYADFRRMLDEERDLDAVLIAAPDHVHALAALMAMERGQHVFVQKPLTYSVEESRLLKEAAARTGVVTQMGNQGHSSDDGRRVVELVRGGAIGPVYEVLAWTDRPARWWAQGVARPEPEPVPPGVEWDLFLGPAEARPYYPGIHPFGWRGWVDFGVGALGDMGAHLLDFPFWALELGQPSRVETRHSPWGGSPADPATYPLATVTTYHFTSDPNPVKLTWFDGGLMPPTPREAPEGFRLNPGGGVMYVGERGLLIHDTYGANPRFLPEELGEQAAAIPQSIRRIQGGQAGHEQNWIRAIRGEEEVSCPFSYGADLNEMMLLGMVAMQANQPIEYDAEAMRITNAPGADRHLRRTYRAGWELPTL